MPTLKQVVFRVLDKLGTSFVEPRREDGHGSAAGDRTFVEDQHDQPLTDDQLRAADVPVDIGSGGSVTVLNPTADPETGLAKEATLASVLGRLDITLSSLRDALRGAGGKTLTDLWGTLQGQREIAESLWTDETGSFYVRRLVVDESTDGPELTVSWTDRDGAPSAGPGAGARPASAPDRDGVAYEFEDADGLGPGETHVGTVFDTQGHRTVKLTVTTDQVSATDGVQIRWFVDEAATQEVLPATSRTLDASDAAAGGFRVLVIPVARYGRLEYANGGSQQSSFFAQVTLHASPLSNPIAQLSAQVTLNNLAVMTLGMLMGADDADVVDIIRRSAGAVPGLRVSVADQEIAVADRKYDSVQGNATTFGTSAVQIAGSPPTDCQAVMIQCDPDNSKIGYLGTDSGVTTSNAMHALAAGASAVFPVGSGQAYWIIGGGANLTARWTFLRRANLP